MKVFGIGRNYAAHIEELNNERPGQPVVFLKPDTAIIKNAEPFYFPKFTNNIHHEVEVVLKISKMGKHIEEKFAHKYYNEIALGIDFTARDLQQTAKEKRLPWTIAKGFDGSAPISKFVPKNDFDLNNLNFELKINNESRQIGNTSMMLFSFDYIISYLSQFFTLKVGDIIFTGTPKGVGPIKVGDQIAGYLEHEQLLSVEVK